jgi:hypothetical protein
MANEQFVYLGTPTNETSRKSSKVREDRRTVTIRQSGLLLTSIGDASTLRLVDQRGKGTLLSVKIVTDNPYVQLLMEIDDWRNDGETPAELLYGGTGKQDYGLYAMDGGNPAKGYTMMYTPMGGEAFDGRLRIQLRNRLPKTKIYGNNTSQTMPGGLPYPVNNGHAGGASFSAPLLAGATNQQLIQAMAMPHYGEPYRAPQINLSLLGNMNAKPGIDHPFVGQAGKPIFAGASTSFPGGSAADENTFIFGPQTADANGVTTQIIYVANRGSDAATESTTTFAAGTSLFIRDGGNLHFPGEISEVALNTVSDGTCDTNHTAGLSDGSSTSVKHITMDSTAKLTVGMSVTGTGVPASATVAAINNATCFTLSANTTATNANQAFVFTTPIPTSVAGAFTHTVSDTTQHNAVSLTVSPGISNPPTMVNVAATSVATSGAMTNAGVVTSEAATDPKILIKSIEIKYRLEVSYDG